MGPFARSNSVHCASSQLKLHRHVQHRLFTLTSKKMVLKPDAPVGVRDFAFHSSDDGSITAQNVRDNWRASFGQPWHCMGCDAPVRCPHTPPLPPQHVVGRLYYPTSKQSTLSQPLPWVRAPHYAYGEGCAPPAPRLAVRLPACAPPAPHPSPRTARRLRPLRLFLGLHMEAAGPEVCCSCRCLPGGSHAAGAWHIQCRPAGCRPACHRLLARRCQHAQHLQRHLQRPGGQVRPCLLCGRGGGGAAHP